MAKLPAGEGQPRPDLQNLGDVVSYGKERGLLEEGEKPEVIIEHLKALEEEFGYNPNKAKIMEAIIDHLRRNKKGKNPAMTGTIGLESQRSTITEKVTSNNPREYLDLALGEFAETTALESEFIDGFIKNNNRLTEEAKKFMIKEVSGVVGPWYVRNHVHSVTQEGNRITVAGKNFETFYYLPEEK